MSVTSGGTAPNPCRRGGSWSLGARLGRDRRRLLDLELAAFAPPGPDRAFEVRGVDHDAGSRAHEPDHAQAAPPAPFGGWHRGRSSARCAGPGDPRSGYDGHTCSRAGPPARPVLELGRQSPRSSPCSREAGSTRSHSAFLGPAVDLPAAEDVKRLAVHDKDAWRAVGTVLAAAAEGADVDAFRPAMDRVGSRVAGFLNSSSGSMTLWIFA